VAPLKLTDSEMDIVLAVARPLAVQDRDAFLQDVAKRSAALHRSGGPRTVVSTGRDPPSSSRPIVNMFHTFATRKAPQIGPASRPPDMPPAPESRLLFQPRMSSPYAAVCSRRAVVSWII
jgi:hypothetical protein